jgi:hypothetical protein
MMDGRDLASITSGGNNRDDQFDFSSLQTTGKKMDFGKTHFLKRGCHKILSMTTKQKAEELLSLHHTQRSTFPSHRRSQGAGGRRNKNEELGCTIYERSPIGVNKNRLNQTMQQV